MSSNPIATTAQRKAVLDAIDKAEREMLPGGIQQDLQAMRTQADLAYDRLKFSGQLRRMEDDRALIEQLKWEGPSN